MVAKRLRRHLHLDLVGGISGDMFIGALLDANPDCVEGLGRVVDLAGFPDLVKLECAAFNDGVLSGLRFNVKSADPASGHNHSHPHRHYGEIRERIESSALPENTKRIAQDIFRRIAEAEAAIHGKNVEDVAFHEIGAWDSIADITLAAHLIDSSGAGSWSASAIPIGKGRVDTAHGQLPVPAPATSLLLQGFEFLDDGVEGERVTPTGAAILAHLSPGAAIPRGRLLTQGYGFGARRLPGLANVLRVSVFETSQADAAVWHEDQVIRLSFEVDDQTPEDLGRALDALRRKEGVIDVREGAYGGKKNRHGHAVTALVSPAAERDVTAFCFDHTSTLGIRREFVSRAILPRREYRVEHQGRTYGVKVVRRPGGLTAKVDMDDLATAGGLLAEREALRKAIESLGLELAARDFQQ